MRFAKGHGTANDFVLLPDLDGALDLTDAAVQAICDRRRGIGGDGVLRVVRTSATEYADVAAEAPWFMDYRNADGGAVEMCGNGIRVFARYLVEQGHADGDALHIATRDGVKRVWLRSDDEVTVDMGPPTFDAPAPPPDGATFVSMGNPHVVLFVDDLASAPVDTVGPRLDDTMPDGANVEFAVVRGTTDVGMRVWERGVGETYSCGTGACAVAVAAHRRGDTGRHVDVWLPGGGLHVDWLDDDSVHLTGPATIVAHGELRDDWLTEAR